MTNVVHGLGINPAMAIPTVTATIEARALDVAPLMLMDLLASSHSSRRASEGGPLRNQVAWHGSQPTNHLFDVVGDLRGDSRTSSSRPRADNMIMSPSSGSQSVRHKKMGTKYSRSQDYGDVRGRSR
ncbi:hypothetical protein PFICI_11793 [Pestalotiopsis fici W106-1]|uniref:Uncharacterized protein n=1 Tax=Pestalotiopsis fici (strain W106-1 / CGMCC3.15140) TaxID=1229662 RepID=W3WU80_PESFW|nr:uncharacterized protein PFICI_11793 [Pestalotiopsis fici W106-1]ETS76406.1 hypothetical protein PFICI_11793 [Pestalotiopsis fici W106-1]